MRLIESMRGTYKYELNDGRIAWITGRYHWSWQIGGHVREGFETKRDALETLKKSLHEPLERNLPNCHFPPSED